MDCMPPDLFRWFLETYLDAWSYNMLRSTCRRYRRPFKQPSMALLEYACFVNSYSLWMYALKTTNYFQKIKPSTMCLQMHALMHNTISTTRCFNIIKHVTTDPKFDTWLSYLNEIPLCKWITPNQALHLAAALKKGDTIRNEAALAGNWLVFETMTEQYPVHRSVDYEITCHAAALTGNLPIFKEYYNRLCFRFSAGFNRVDFISKIVNVSCLEFAWYNPQKLRSPVDQGLVFRHMLEFGRASDDEIIALLNYVWDQINKWYKIHTSNWEAAKRSGRPVIWLWLRNRDPEAFHNYKNELIAYCQIYSKEYQETYLKWLFD